MKFSFIKQILKEKTNLSKPVTLLALIFATVTATISLGACTKSATPTEEILIGEVGSMSGSEATFGMDAHRGIVLAVQKVNAAGGVRGKMLKLITLDDQGKAEEATSNATQLINRQHVLAMVGGLPSSRALALAPIAQKGKTPFVGSISTNAKVTQFGDFIFRVCFIDPFQGQIMAKFATQNLKLKKIALLKDVKSDYSMGLSDFFVTTLEKMGGEIISQQSYGSGDIDFKSQLTAIRAKNPEAIYIPGYYTEVALIARQARELGINVPLLAGDGLDSPKFLEISGSFSNNTYYSTHYSSDNEDPIVRNFISDFRHKYGMTPGGHSTLGYDSVMVLVDAMNRSNTLSQEDIRDALKQTDKFAAVTGQLSFDQDRNPIKSAVILKIEEGKIKYHSSVTP